MKKLIALVMSLILIIPSAGSIALAAPELEITSPANGAVIEYAIEVNPDGSVSYDKLAVTATVPANTRTSYFYLNGTEIGSDAGGGEVSVDISPSVLYAGKHSLDVYALLDDGIGTVNHASCEFNIKLKEKIYGLNENFDTIQSDASGNVLLDSSNIKGTNNNIRWKATGVASSTSSFKISNSDGNKILELHSGNGGGSYKSMYTEAYFGNSFDDVVDVEMRFKVSASDGSGGFTLGFLDLPEGEGRSNIANIGKTSTWDGFFNIYTGFIKNFTTNWYDMKIKLDYKTKLIDVWLDGKLVTSNDVRDNISTSKLFTYLKIVSIPGNAAVDFVTLVDYLKVSESITYSGIDKIFSSDGITELTQATPVSKNIGGFVVKTAEEFKEDSEISLYSNGVKAATGKYKAASGGFVIENVGSLDYGSKLEFVIDDKQLLADGNKTNFPTRAALRVEQDDYAVDIIGITDGNGNMILDPLTQLSGGASVGFKTNINNVDGAAKDRLLIIAIYDDIKFIGMNALTVPSQIGSHDYTVSYTIPNGISKLKVKALVCDRWNSLAPISELYIR